MSSSEERFALLISKCRSASDADTKLDAVTKLQTELEATSQLFDVEGLVAGLKTCLRTPNQHLSTATLSAIVLLFPLLVHHRPSSPGYSSSSSNPSSSVSDSSVLRQALNAFLPAGGIFDRLGDNRERAREKAKEALIVIGTTVFKSSGPLPAGSTRGKEAKGSETPLQTYERFLREQGLLSKSWRVREQSILILVRLRRNHPQFPIRPYLPSLVDALEDGDGTVRDCARQSVVEIFTGQGVTDAARTDLKKEMTKKGVRKAIVDGVLTKLMGGEGRRTPSGDSVDGKDEGVQVAASLARNSVPSMPAIGRSVTVGAISGMDRPISRTGDNDDVAPVYIASARDLENEFLKMLPYFEGKETEHNWLLREQSVIRIRGMLKGEAHSRYPETFIAGLKNGVLDGTLKALASLRTTVTACACSLYNDLAVSLGPGLDLFVETLLTHLLRMAGFTKKITATQSQNVVDTLLVHTSCHPRQSLPLLWLSVQDKTVQARVFAAGHVKVFLDCHGMRSKHTIDASGGVEILDKCVRKGLIDPNPGVREKARASFWSFEPVWKERGLAIMESLDAPAKKQLQNASPVPIEQIGISKPTTPASKKSSVAAAIAASRAKAKQIATAPPTLRHQATSTLHAQASRATSPPSQIRRSTSPVIAGRGTSLSPRAGSPSSPPRTSILRSSPSKNARGSVSPPVVNHQRARSSGSLSPSPPPSPTNGAHVRHPLSSLVAKSPKRTVLPLGPSNTTSFSPRTSSALRASLHPTRDTNQTETSGQGLSVNADESVLMATSIPLPSGSDLTDDDSVNLMSFSAPWELSHSSSQAPTSTNSTPSTSRIGRIPHSVVEDALRARAAQAESAAEQLLELVEPDDGEHISPIPPSLLLNNRSTPKPPSRTVAAPVTPINQTSAIMRQAALFQDSPKHAGGSPSVFDLIEERKHQTGWWLKRMSVIDQGKTPSADFSERTRELDGYIVALENDIADLSVLRGLTVVCHRNPRQDITSPPTSPVFAKAPMSPLTPSPHANFKTGHGFAGMLGDVWEGGKRSERLFNALCKFLRPDQDAELLEHGLFVLWEMLPHLDGRDADILALLLRLRYAQDFNVDEGTLTIRDAQVELMNERNFSLYGLSTMNICLRTFLDQPMPPFALQDAKLRAHAFGLITMAKFIVMLPSDILEEELPKLKSTLTDAYLNSEAMVRQAATTAITAAQVILQDEAHLFALLEPLPDDKKNLLTYFFEKNNARGSVERVGGNSSVSGMERLSKEMDRLDQRISTPPKRL